MFGFHFKTLTYFLAIVVGGSISEAAEFVIRPTAQVDSPILRLGDLAEIIGTQAEITRFKSMELAVAPATNASRRMKQGEIRELLALRGVNPIQHRVRGAAEVEIRRSGPTIRYKTVGANTSPRLNTLPVDPQADQPVQVVVAARALRPGDLISRRDLQTESRIKRRVQRGMMQDLELVIGMEVRRPLSAGQTVLDRDVRPPLVVKRKEKVTLVVRVGNVVIRTDAKALEDGELHQSIIVEMENKKRVAAEVVGYQQVEVRKGQRTDAANKPRASEIERARRQRYAPNRRTARQTPVTPYPLRTAAAPQGA